MNLARSPNQSWFLALLVVNLVASICHYSDNLLHFDQYPEPDWFKPLLTDSIWLVMTPFGLIGYWLYCKALFPWAYICLYIYGGMSLIVFGHYTVLPPWEVSYQSADLGRSDTRISVDRLYCLGAISTKW